MNLCRKEIAERMGLTDNVLKHTMSALNLSMRAKYTNISRDALNSLVADFHLENSELGMSFNRFGDASSFVFYSFIE